MTTAYRNPILSGERIRRLKEAVQNAQPVVCPERALLWTDYFKNRTHRKKHLHIRMAEALRHVLLHKSITIHPDERIVGNFTSGRVGGGVFPELHGVQMLAEIGTFPLRPVNPMRVSPDAKKKLRWIIPFWLFRNTAARTYRSPLRSVPFLLSQLKPRHYLINELGGIVHFAPDYAALIRIGSDGMASRAENRQRLLKKDSDEWNFCEAVRVSAEALSSFGERYAALAETMAAEEGDSQRKEELKEIARICRHVPRNPARNFHEALQSILFAHIAINQESLDATVSLGRMDQVLYEFYERDCGRGILDRAGAKELLSCFSIKLCETVPVFSKLIARFHSGLPSFQTLVVGGMDKDGNDASNELSYIFLEIMDELTMRQPNFQARIHGGASERYREAVYSTLAHGGNSLAVYNDEIIVPTMAGYGYSLQDARDYTPVGCVEPTCPGKSFASTDAVLFNVPILIELALNRGRRFGSMIRTGAKTPDPVTMGTMREFTDAFERQLRYLMAKMITDLRHVERVHTRFKPTPLSSMMIDGCIENARCSTAGGATYNFSGIQCVGPSDAGDSLHAIERLVFKDRRLTLKELTGVLKQNISDAAIHARMKTLPGFGNGDESADRWTRYVIDVFVSVLESFGKNTRNGRYVTGLYSSTAHEYFGSETGALPSGRRRGESFASGVAPMNGRDRKGVTALIHSMNSLDYSRCPNGMNFNIRFQSDIVAGAEGTRRVGAFLTPYFDRGGMQVQVNVLDRETLVRARKFPDQFPNLLVRVSGYSAYFNDLSDAMKDELISRTENAA
jgi:formate C-acetyltransferase